MTQVIIGNCQACGRRGLLYEVSNFLTGKVFRTCLECKARRA